MGYNGHPTGCLCPSCGHHRELRRASNRRARERRRRGESCYGDYDAVAAHLRALVDAGCALRWIADAAGVRPETVSDLFHGRRRRVYAETAAALLPVRPRRAARAAARRDHALIPALGTVRRLRALAAKGHPLYRVAERTGVAYSHARLLARGKQPLVTTPVARAIAKVYDELWNVDGHSARTRNRARAKGWVPPLAWDDDTIDNPQAEPLPYARRTRNRRGPGLAVDAAELARRGLTRAEIAERLGVSAYAITAAWHRHGNPNNHGASHHDVA